MPKRTAAAVSKPTANSKPKKTASGYKFPEHIPPGFVIKDTKKQEWCIHETIGTGGFGEIYSASDANQTSKLNSTQPYAIKVEPKENGPLYVEMHFYMRVGKAEDIEAWKQKKKLKTFGMPVLRGSGSFEYKSNSYRFLVTDKLGCNLHDILKQNNHCFPHVTALQIGVQVLNLLEYIHGKGYIHGDIKAANMMLGLHPGSENTVYVIDFGLAAKCSASDIEYKKDPKKAQNGTIEYISRDGHIGVFGFRGDLEILGYNLLHWINGSLPWEKDVANAAIVEEKKIQLMNNPSAYIKKHLPKVTEELIKYMDYIGSLKNNDLPDYEYCRKLLTDKLSNLKCSSPYGKLIFASDKNIEVSSPKKLKLAPKGKAGRKRVTSLVSPINSPLKTRSTRNARKRNSPISIGTSSKEDEKELIKNKRPTKKNIDSEPLPSCSSDNIEEGNDDSVYITANSGAEEESGDESSKKSRRVSRRSSIKFTVKKKSPKIKGLSKKLKATGNLLSEKKMNGLNPSESESSSVTSLQSEKNGNSANNILKAKRNKKMNDENKPSWKDAPTVVASNIKKAGEYVKVGSSTGKASKKKK